MRRGVLVVGLLLFAFLGGAQAAAASNLNYYGGPVTHSMNVVLVPWGASVRSTYTDKTTGDPGFFNYLASQSGTTSDIGGVLAQYLDTSGQNSVNAYTFAGSFPITPSVGATPPGTVNDSDIHSELKKDIAAATLPAPSGDGLSTIYVTLFPPGDEVCDSGGTCSTGVFCAYHGSFPLTGSTHVLYAAMVDNGPGSPNNGGCGANQTDVNNQTSVTTHEFSETINDPLVAEATGFGPPLAWYDPNGNQGEIGDKCNAQQGLNGTFTVQKEWSNLTGACVVGEAGYSQPIAAFTPPAGAAASQATPFDGSSSSDPASNHTSASYLGTNYSIAAGIASYDWNWGDGTANSPGASPTHTYAAGGNYNVSLTVTDNLGFTGTSTHQVSVVNPPPSVTTASASAVSATTALLQGSINSHDHAGSYLFVYGTSPSSLSSATASTAAPAGQVNTPISAMISGLSPSTTYFYRLEMATGGQTLQGSTQSFTTTAAPPPPPRPVAGTGSATQITTGSAVLNGTINPDGAGAISYHFAYGTSSVNLGQATAQSAGPSGTTASPVNAAVSGLTPNTKYYYRLDVSFGGQTYSDSVQSFTTIAPAPSAKSGRARVHGVKVALSGKVNPHGVATRYHFELGKKKGRYSKSSSSGSAGSGGSAQTVSALITGLHPHRVYHYRLVATSAGGTVAGADKKFKTGAKPRHAPKFSFKLTGHHKLSDALVHGLRISFRCSAACRASSSAFPVLPGILNASAVPVTVGRGSAALHARGAGVMTLRFTAAARRQLRNASSLKLNVTGSATSGGADDSATAPPIVVTLTR